MPSYTFPFILQENTTAADDAEFVNGSWQFNGVMSSITFWDDDTSGLGEQAYGSETGSSAIITHVDGDPNHPLVGQIIHMSHVRSDHSDLPHDNDADAIFLTTDDGTGMDAFGVAQYPGSNWEILAGETFISSDTDLPDGNAGGGAWIWEAFISGTVPEQEMQIFDAILHPGSPGLVNETMSTADGEFLSVQDGISATAMNPPLIGEGDTLVINGHPWHIIDIQSAKGIVVFDGGASSESTSFVALEVSNGTEILTYYFPDASSDYVGITSFTPTNISDQASMHSSLFTGNQDVTLSFPDAETPTLYDFILTTVTMPGVGDNLTYEGGELVHGVVEPVSFVGGSNPATIETGSLMYVGSDVYLVTSTFAQNVTLTYNSGEDTATANVMALEVTDGIQTWTYYATADGEIYPEITEIIVNTSFEVVENGIPAANFDADDNVHVICFAEGTGIATVKGARNVETLEVGDRVLTADNGFQEIQWIGKRTVPAQGKLAPIVITKGTYGAEKDLRVSPQHRILISDWRAELMFGSNEALVAAKHLVNGETIYREQGGEVTYFHVLFENHEIIFSEGVATESFHPGDHSVAGLEEGTRAELFELFPELAAGDFTKMQSARMSLKGFEVEALYA